jgi:hypothetical protein
MFAAVPMSQSGPIADIVLMILHDPTMGTTALADVKVVAKSLGLQFILSEADDPAKFAEIFADAQAQGVNGITTMASPR